MIAWTYKQLRKADELHRARWTWAEIGEHYGTTAASVKAAVTRAKKRGQIPVLPRQPARIRQDLEEQTFAALAIRNQERASWPLICQRVAPGTCPAALRMRVYSYTRRHGLRVYRGPPEVTVATWGRP